MKNYRDKYDVESVSDSMINVRDSESMEADDEGDSIFCNH